MGKNETITISSSQMQDMLKLDFLSCFFVSFKLEVQAMEDRRV